MNCCCGKIKQRRSDKDRMLPSLSAIMDASTPPESSPSPQQKYFNTVDTPDNAVIRIMTASPVSISTNNDWNNYMTEASKLLTWISRNTFAGKDKIFPSSLSKSRKLKEFYSKYKMEDVLAYEALKVKLVKEYQQLRETSKGCPLPLELYSDSIEAAWEQFYEVFQSKDTSLNNHIQQLENSYYLGMETRANFKQLISQLKSIQNLILNGKHELLLNEIYSLDSAKTTLQNLKEDIDSLTEDKYPHINYLKKQHKVANNILNCLLSKLEIELTKTSKYSSDDQKCDQNPATVESVSSYQETISTCMQWIENKHQTLVDIQFTDDIETLKILRKTLSELKIEILTHKSDYLETLRTFLVPKNDSDFYAKVAKLNKKNDKLLVLTQQISNELINLINFLEKTISILSSENKIENDITKLLEEAEMVKLCYRTPVDYIKKLQNQLRDLQN